MKKEIGLITPGTNQIKVHNKSYFTLRKISKAFSNLGENLISQTDLVRVNARSVKQNILLIKDDLEPLMSPNPRCLMKG